MQERRTNPRVGISFPVECNELPNKRSYFYTVSRDLSTDGAKILSEKFIPTGNVMKVNINLINKIVDVKAKVIWCNKERASERYSAGLQFVEVNSENQAALSYLINKIHLA